MRAVVDLVLPLRCVGCGSRGALLCAPCAVPLAGPARLSWPTPAPAGMPAPYAVADYERSVREVIVAFKERGAVPLQQPLGRALARAVLTAVQASNREGPVALVPVPSSRAARLARGDDVTARLARRAAVQLRLTGLRADAVPAVRHVRAVADSAGLGTAERARNLRGAFTARPGAARAIAGRPVVLVDDLVTTGVTLTECADAMRAAGANVLAAATVAATRRHAVGHPADAQSAVEV